MARRVPGRNIGGPFKPIVLTGAFPCGDSADMAKPRPLIKAILQ